MRVSLGTMVRLLLCDLEVTSSNRGNSLSACNDRTAYTFPPKTPLGGSLVYWAALFTIL